MLDTVRAYGLERLAEAGEETDIRDAAARYYLDLVEAADPLLRTRTQARWFRVLTAEQDNINAAIRWVTARTRRARCGSSARLATTGPSAATARPTRCAARSSP